MDGAAAGGAPPPQASRQIVGDGPLGALFGQHPHHGGNHLPRLLHQHHVPHPDVLPGNLVLVVEGCPGNGGAGEGDRLQFRHGGEDSGAPHLDGDGLQAGGGPFRLVLVGLRPAGRLGGHPQEFPLAEGIHLDDRAVGVIGHGAPDLVQFLDGRLDLLEIPGDAAPLLDLQP